MDRKTFLQRSIVVCGTVMVGGSLIERCMKDNSVSPATNVNFTLDLNAPANAGLKTIGGSLLNNSIIVICTDTSTYTALSSVCTHQGCTVAYDQNSKTLICPCHGGSFNLSGSVIAGPPPSALMKYRTSLSGNILTVTS